MSLKRINTRFKVRNENGPLGCPRLRMALRWSMITKTTLHTNDQTANTPKEDEKEQEGV